MPYVDIASRVTVSGHQPGSNFPDLIRQTLAQIYNGSSLAAAAAAALARFDLLGTRPCCKRSVDCVIARCSSPKRMTRTVTATVLLAALSMAACGSGGGNGEPPGDSAASAGKGTTAAPADRNDRLAVSAATRISVETRFDDQVAQALAVAEGDRSAFGNRILDVLSRAFPSPAGAPSRLHPAGAIADDGSNIIVVHRVEMNDRGEPYRMVLEARQRERIWRRSFERGAGRERAGLSERIAGEEGPLMNLTQRLAGSLQLDARDLALLLVEHLQEDN